MPKPPDLEKRARLMSALVEHVQVHGLQDLSLQRLAEGVGSSPRMLLHYYGSADQLRIALYEELGKAFRGLISALPMEDLSSPERLLRESWRLLMTPSMQKVMRVFYELYGMSLQHSSPVAGFAKQAVEAYIQPLSLLAELWGVPPDKRAAVATMILAMNRSLLADFLATNDVDRVQQAHEWMTSVIVSAIAGLSGNDLLSSHKQGARPDLQAR